MAKALTTVSLDYDLVIEYKKRPDINLSGLVNRLLREYLGLGNTATKEIPKVSYETASILLSETKRKIVTLEKQKETINPAINPDEYNKINMEIERLLRDAEMYRQIKIAQVENYNK